MRDWLGDLAYQRNTLVSREQRDMILKMKIQKVYMAWPDGFMGKLHKGTRKWHNYFLRNNLGTHIGKIYTILFPSYSMIVLIILI